MSHFVDTMAFVGEVPWHGLGTYLGEENVTGEKMLAASGLDWQAEKVQVFYPDTSGLNYHEVDGQFTMVRSDTGKSLGCTVGSKYTPFQNEQLFEFGDALIETGDVRWHTAGSLKEGRKVWGLAQLSGEQVVNRRDGTKDVSAPFLLLYNSHDGSSCLTARLTSVRVVCWNTLTCALSGDQSEFRARHTASVSDRASSAAEVLGLAVDAAEGQREVMQHLADTPFNGEQFAAFCAQLITGKDDRLEALQVAAQAVGSSKTQLNRKAGELAELFASGDGNKGEDRYDAVNAVTQFIDRQRNRIGDWRKLDAKAQGKRLDSQLFGSGEKTKTRALRLLQSA